MISIPTPTLIVALLGLASANPTAHSGPLVYHNWPPIAASSRAHMSPTTHHHHHQQHHPQQLQQSVHHHQHHHRQHHPLHTAPATSPSAQLMFQQQSQPHHAMRYAPASSGAAAALQSAPSNLVYTHQKLRPLQSQSMAMLGPHSNRYVRPGGAAAVAAATMLKHYTMPSAKPASSQYPTYVSVPHYSGSSSANVKRHPPAGISVPSATKSTFVKSPALQQQSANKHYAKNKPAQPIVDYVFEKPLFGQHQLQQQHDVTPVTTTLTTFVTGRPQQQQPPKSQATASKYSPIHTIQAPNLSMLEQKPFANFLNQPLLDNNHLFEKDSMFPAHMALTADRPTSIPQYQVTESTNDQHAVRNSLGASNSPPLFMPDMNKMPLSVVPAQQQFTHADPQFSSPGNQPAASALVQHQLTFPSPSSAIAASETAASYATHLKYNQQMLQPYQQPPSAQQPQVMTGVHSMAAYNPTYLVQQSNHLFDQHKQHLFKPDRQYLHQHQPHQQRTHPLVADLIESEFLPSYQLPSGDYVPHHVVHQQQQQQQITNEPANPGVNALTVLEVSNLLNYGTIHQQEPLASEAQTSGQQQVGFVASNFFQQAQPNTAALISGNNGGGGFNDDSIYRHQQQNEERINEANRLQIALLQQQQVAELEPALTVTHRPAGDESTIFVTRSPEQRASEAEAESAHQRHQLRLAEQMGTDMRIYVPDEDYSAEQSDTFHKRSDDFGSDREMTTIEPEDVATATESAAEVTQLKPVYELVDETMLDLVTISNETSVPTTDATTNESNTTSDNDNNTIIVSDNLSVNMEVSASVLADN